MAKYPWEDENPPHAIYFTGADDLVGAFEELGEEVPPELLKKERQDFTLPEILQAEGILLAS